MEPESVKETLSPGQEREFKVTITPAADAKAGRYMVRTAFGWDGTYVVKEYVAEVTAFEAPLILIVAAVSVFAAGVYYGYRLSAQGRARASDKFMLREKLRRIKSSISTARPAIAEQEMLKSELPALRKMRAEIKSLIVRSEPPSSNMAALERLKNSIKRKNKDEAAADEARLGEG